MRILRPTAVLAAALFAGCSGGGSGPSVTPVSGSGSGSGTTSTQSSSTYAIADANAVGAPLANYIDFDTTLGASTAGTQIAAVTRDAATANGACKNGVEFFAPDKNGDENSTETIAFFDTACTQPARDIVRVYAANGAGAENVNLTSSLYAPGNTTAIATRSETHAITNASFNAYGYPVASSGFDLVGTDSLTIAGSVVRSSKRELVLNAASSGSNSFCADSAGYNVTGFPSLNKTFGTAGTSSGTRTANADGSVTWSSTRTGTSYSGAIGALSIVTGTQNTSCPISTPDFTLSGGTAIGTHTIPMTATFAHGMLVSLTIANATLNNGDSLSVVTNSGQSAGSSNFITGTVSNGSTQIATFSVNAFGDGTLTVTATGAQYVITAWHVIR